RRYSQPLSAIMLDIDRFKNLNDTRGHHAGDVVLRNVADNCRLHLREVDLLGRYGGDEFVILLPSTSVGQAEYVADRIRTVVSATTIPTGAGGLSVTLSIGVVEYEQNMTSLEPLLERADQALLAAKRLGRNRVECWKPEYAEHNQRTTLDSRSD
ncbi:MAG TPA: GGDEF domain-containing protein, partial [Acidobacteriota bacterium]|nr:GGDEF domain-containing protein [Acidobacteriota bacterium]